MLAALTILTIKENKKALHLAQITTLQRPQEAGPQIQQRPLQTVRLDTCEHPGTLVLLIQPPVALARIRPWPLAAARSSHMRPHLGLSSTSILSYTTGSGNMLLLTSTRLPFLASPELSLEPGASPAASDEPEVFTPSP